VLRARFRTFAWRTTDRSWSRSILLCAQQARLGERALKKPFLQRRLANLGMQRLQINQCFGRFLVLSKHAGGAFQKLVPLGRDLVRVNIKRAPSATVFSPFTAAKATFALNAAECVLRDLFVIFAPDSQRESSPLRKLLRQFQPIQRQHDAAHS